MIVTPVPPLHPAAAEFPMIDGLEFDQLVDSIRTLGQRHRCLMWKGMLLDGRNRWRACAALGIEPKTEEFQGTEDEAIDYIVALNLRRRDLNPTQRAVIAAAMEPHYAEAAARAKAEKAREQAGVPKTHRLVIGPTISQIVEPSSVVKPEDRKAAAQAAKAAGANRQYVADVKRIREKAPELVEQMRTGKVTVPEAKRLMLEAERPTDSPPAEGSDEPPPSDVDGRIAELYRYLTTKEVATELGLKKWQVGESIARQGIQKGKGRKSDPLKPLRGSFQAWGYSVDLWLSDDAPAKRRGASPEQYLEARELLVDLADKLGKLLQELDKENRYEQACDGHQVSGRREPPRRSKLPARDQPEARGRDRRSVGPQDGGDPESLAQVG